MTATGTAAATGADAAMSWPKKPARRALQKNLITGRVVEQLVIDAGGRREYVDTVIELADRHRGITIGASLAAVRRARAAGHVRVDGHDLVLGSGTGA